MNDKHNFTLSHLCAAKKQVIAAVIEKRGNDPNTRGKQNSTPITADGKENQTLVNGEPLDQVEEKLCLTEQV